MDDYEEPFGAHLLFIRHAVSIDHMPETKVRSYSVHWFWYGKL